MAKAKKVAPKKDALKTAAAQPMLRTRDLQHRKEELAANQAMKDKAKRRFEDLSIQDKDALLKELAIQAGLLEGE